MCFELIIKLANFRTWRIRSQDTARFTSLVPLLLNMISVEALGYHTVPVYFSQDGMGDTPNRSDVLALPAFKRRLEQKELRGHYTAQAQMSN